MKKACRKQSPQVKPRRVEDYHHILYQRKHWQQGYAKALREHAYMGKYIPRDTLHREIHGKLHDIPVPRSVDCKIAFEELCRRERLGLIDIEHDTLEKRIDFLISMWKDRHCEATVAMLEWQKEIISKFYSKSSSS